MSLFNFLRYLRKNIKYVFSNNPFVLDQLNYDNEWSKEADNENNSRFIAIEKVIDQGASVLDLGCGNGDLLYYLKKRKKNNK